MTFIKAKLYNRPWYGTIGYPIGIRLDKKLNLTAKDGFKTGKIASSDLAVIEGRIPVFHKRIERQRQHASLLKNTITLKNVELPSENNNCFSNWYQFGIRFQDSRQRDAMAAHLFMHGVDTAKYLDTIVDEAITDYGYIKGECPNSEILSKTLLLIPIHYNLKKRDILNIAGCINQFTN